MIKLKNIRKIVLTLIMAITIIAFLSAPLLAQPIDYGEYENVTTINGTVSGGVARFSNLNGIAGETLELRALLGLLGNTSLTRIYLILKGTLSNVTLTIRKLLRTSVTPPRNAFSFFSVNASNLNSSAISRVDFIFKTPSNYSNIQLYRLVNGRWVALSTEALGREGNINWYRASSPGLSEFAVVGSKGSAGGKLPYTSGLPLYMIGGIGLLLIAGGVGLRLKVR